MNFAGNIRHPAVAGQFYPGDPAALNEAIEAAYLSPLGPGELPQINTSGKRRLLGIISPHAGYLYSGQCAAWSFAEVAKDGRPGAVVILGVNHRGIGAPVALSPADGWRTPLGILPVAKEICNRLKYLDADVSFDASAHELEHSLEVQLPFLQALFGEIGVVPVVISSLSPGEIYRFGNALSQLSGEYDLLLVASTDLSHYVPQQEAEVFDRLALAEIAAINPAGLLEVVRSRHISMCGVLPVAALLTAAKASGGVTANILHYHTSGDVIGSKREVVGYGAVAFYR